MNDRILLLFFDHSGNQSRPYAENGWHVIKCDIKDGCDILNFDIIKAVDEYPDTDFTFGIIAPVPCTAYALSGNRHKQTPERKVIFEYSQKLVAKLKFIIDELTKRKMLLFWQLENPMRDIHTHNPWLGKPRQKFNPCDFAGYHPTDVNADRYNKMTWLWGNFRSMTSKRLEPLTSENPGWRKLGGKSEKTKELRSITPLGFAYAFYEANH